MLDIPLWAWMLVKLFVVGAGLAFGALLVTWLLLLWCVWMNMRD